MTDAPLHILLADDEGIVLQTIGNYLADSGHRVDTVRDGLAALDRMAETDYDLALLDIQMPGMDGMTLLGEIRKTWPEVPAVIITGHGDMETVIQALRLGAADFLPKPVKLLELDGVLEKVHNLRGLLRDRRRLRRTIGAIQTADCHRVDVCTMVGTSPATRAVWEQIAQAVEAACDTILITGETGTGKEVAAREIHFNAGASESPFIAVSCPALPDTLVESELFGHVKGAFTGATAPRAGCFELADGGALFLDEVADLSPAAQAKLLRVLETRRVRRVGGGNEIDVTVRVIAATNAPLEHLVRTGKFREDLYYRLNLFAIHLRPLRERPDDILPLAEHFLAAYARSRRQRPLKLSKDAQEQLLTYSLPGNARELRNIVERAAILCRSDRIQPEHLHLPAARPATSFFSEPEHSAPSVNGSAEREMILDALQKSRWNRRQAARDLNMPYSTLRYKMNKLGIR